MHIHPPFRQNLKKLDFYYRSIHLNDILFNIISFFILFISTMIYIGKLNEVE